MVTFGSEGGMDSDALKPLLAACSPAVFGVGAQTVQDTRCRNALQLPADRLSASFSPARPTPAMLDDIRRLMMPKAESMHAELYALNVHGPDGLFKPHVDTPRAPDMFGSLVLCLPCEFSGGELVVRSPGGQAADVVHDWGAAGLAASGSVGWAAMYSDCEHEILPVRTGHRVTLTYNLYQRAPDAQLAAAPEESALGARLAAALKDPTWYPQGITLGFALERAYAVPGDPDAPVPRSIRPAALKGSDLLLHQAACKLGLEERLVPVQVLGGQEYDDNGRSMQEPASGPEYQTLQPDQLAIGEFRPSDGSEHDDDDGHDGALFIYDYFTSCWDTAKATEEEFVQGSGLRIDAGLAWIKAPSAQHLHYRRRGSRRANEEGKYPAHKCWFWYAAAALLIEVPAADADVRR